MKPRTIVGVGVIVVVSVVRLSFAAGVPFRHLAIDDSVKDPWAKIIADIDKDGFPDIVIGGRAGPLVWYHYPDWTKAVIAEGGYRTVDGEAGDVDGDGDLDIVMGGLIWYENPLPKSKPGRTIWIAHPVADHKTHDIELADLDRDGKLDIVTRDQSDFGAKAGDKVYLWRQERGDKWTPRIIECPHGEGLALGDLDGDGDQDVVIGGVWFENSGSILDGPWQAHRFGAWHPSASVEVADINGDGRPDVVLSPSELAGNWYRLSWFETPADPKQTGWTEHVVVERMECVVHGLATADFNGDGNVDIAASEMHQGQDPDEVVLFINRNKGSGWDRQVLSTKGSHCIQAGDIGDDGDIDLVGANWSGPYQPVELWANQSRGGARRDGYEYRALVRVGAGDFDREPRPVEVPLDFTQLLQKLGRTISGNDLRIRLLDVDASGRVIREVEAVQFDKATDLGPQANLSGTLTFMLEDPMAAHTEQSFLINFDFERHEDGSAVVLADEVEYAGQKSFKISTAWATYYYHQQGAGFASIVDLAGHDWLSYNSGVGPASKSGSGGKYRGLPNMVHPEGYFHPGNDQCTSRLLARGPVKATILSESQDGKWACQWDIFPFYARLTVLRADHPYWFLYEGTPGGKLDEDSDYCVRSNGTKMLASVRWDGDVAAKGETAEWLYFGDGALDRVLYLIHEEDDDEVDSYWPMNHEMTVFGFGRKGLNKYTTQVPAHFIVGFCENTDFAAVSRTVASACRPLSVAVGEPETRTQAAGE